MSESDRDLIDVRYEDGIAVMTMNYPERRNAFNMQMRTQMYERLLQIEADEQCGALVLTGADGNFCAGGDVSEMRQRGLIEARMRMDLPTRIFKLLVNGPKPFIVAAEGAVAGCGVSFVAASDYCVAASNAKFLCAFVKVGLMPDVGGIWSIPRKVGHRKAMEMCALAETYGAEEALAMNLINRICEPGQTLGLAIEVARKFARNPPVATALLRSALNLGNDGVDQAVNTEINFQSVLMHTEDFGEAARAFLEKRKPRFTGK